MLTEDFDIFLPAKPNGVDVPMTVLPTNRGFAVRFLSHNGYGVWSIQDRLSHMCFAVRYLHQQQGTSCVSSRFTRKQY